VPNGRHRLDEPGPEPGEPRGFLFEARTPWADTIGARASGREDRIWIERSGGGFTMYYPSER
jgi:hypothetical protein